MAALDINFTFNNDLLTKILTQLTDIGTQMATQQEQINTLTAQVNKVFTEVTLLKSTLEAAVADLELQLDNNMPVDLTALQTAVQSIDDIVIDPVSV